MYYLYIRKYHQLDRNLSFTPQMHEQTRLLRITCLNSPFLHGVDLLWEAVITSWNNLAVCPSHIRSLPPTTTVGDPQHTYIRGQRTSHKRASRFGSNRRGIPMMLSSLVSCSDFRCDYYRFSPTLSQHISHETAPTCSQFYQCQTREPRPRVIPRSIHPRYWRASRVTMATVLSTYGP